MGDESYVDALRAFDFSDEIRDFRERFEDYYKSQYDIAVDLELDINFRGWRVLDKVSGRVYHEGRDDSDLSSLYSALIESSLDYIEQSINCDEIDKCQEFDKAINGIDYEGFDNYHSDHSDYSDYCDDAYFDKINRYDPDEHEYY